MTEEVTEVEVAETASVEQEVSQPNDDAITKVAQEVISGLWSRGNKRDAKLREAGYDPDAVRQEVNRIFNGST